MKLWIDDRIVDVTSVRYELNQGLTIAVFGLKDPLSVIPLGQQAINIKLESSKGVLYQTEDAYFRNCEVMPNPRYEFKIPNIE